ncbi:hypothetical protein ACQ2GE_004215, partial [Yersinia enterocolitica]
GADALLFYLSSPYKIESLGFCQQSDTPGVLNLLMLPEYPFAHRFDVVGNTPGISMPGSAGH